MKGQWTMRKDRMDVFRAATAALALAAAGWCATTLAAPSAQWGGTAAEGGGKVLHGGVRMDDEEESEAGATLSGPTTLLVGVPTVYTLDVTLAPGMTDSIGLEANGTAKVVIDPDIAMDLEVSGSLTFTITALNTGTFTLAIYDIEGLSCNKLEVTATDFLRITAMDRAETDMVLTVDGNPTTAYGATEVVDGDWTWKPLDDATIAGDKVIVPMTGRSFLVIKVKQ